MADDSEISAFEGYELSKKERKRKKRSSIVDSSKNIGDTSSNVQAQDTPTSKNPNQSDGSEEEMRVKKKKKKTDASTSVIQSDPISSPEPNVSTAGKKKKRKSDKGDKSESIAVPDIDVSIVTSNENLASTSKKRRKSKKSKTSDICVDVLTPFTSNNGTDAVSESGNCVTDKNNAVPQKQIHPDEEGDSFVTAENIFKWMISTLEPVKFFSDYWERQPLHISRSSPTYYNKLFTSSDLHQAFQHQPIFFKTSVDVVKYVNGVKSVLTPEGRARPELVWHYFRRGCSIRLKNPQTYIPNLGILTQHLEEYFKNMVGMNSYLTPSGCQGFAPHFDDVEAFVLQLEGEKLWKVYPPRNVTERLPFYSSENFAEDEIGKPILEVVLKPGDLLYFPRGYIHHARTVGDDASFHLTVSTFQRNSFYEFFSKALPAALEIAKDEHIELRRGLPRNLIDLMGVVNSDKQSKQRERILEKLNKMADKIVKACPWDAAADQIGKRFIHESYPRRTFVDESRSLLQRQIWLENPTGSVKLISRHCLRLVIEEGCHTIYFNVDNSKEYLGEEVQGIDINESCAPIVEMLIHNYPNFTPIGNLSLEIGVAHACVIDIVRSLAFHSLLFIRT